MKARNKMKALQVNKNRFTVFLPDGWYNAIDARYNPKTRQWTMHAYSKKIVINDEIRNFIYSLRG